MSQHIEKWQEKGKRGGGVERNVKMKQKQTDKKKKISKKKEKKYSLLMIPCAFFFKVKNKDLYLPKLYGGRHAY